jgi:uncharacterized protein (TIGR03118 family)
MRIPSLVKSILFANATLFLASSLVFGQHYNQSNLVANFASTPAPGIMDPNLQNAWGLVASPGGSPWWVSNNAGGTATLYAIDAMGAAHIVPINGNGIVSVANAPSQPAPGSPTGVMFNGSRTDFLLAPNTPALFIWVTEDGTVQGWNPAVSPNAVIKVDNSQVPDAANGAVYKGSTIAEISGQKFILAANFRSGRIDAFDTNFHQVALGEDSFKDDQIPSGFAPFNVQGVGPNIYVTFAKQDAARHDPVGGAGFGFVEVFNSQGRLLLRLQHTASMNAPWGVVWAVQNFGEFSNTILVGQFRGGNVSAFNPVTGRFLGNMLNPDGTTLTIDGLWALRFGNGGNSGLGSTLFFTAGPNGEKDGLLGTLLPIAAEKGEADEQ